MQRVFRILPNGIKYEKNRSEGGKKYFCDFF